jgi:hypothetical protein
MNQQIEPLLKELTEKVEKSVIDQYSLELVKKNGLFLEHVKQTNDICLAAVEQNGKALQYVLDDIVTDKIYLAAVKQNGNALEYVAKQTPEICLAAVQQSAYALRFVRIQTDEICLAAVKNEGCILHHVNNKTKEICLAALNANSPANFYNIPINIRDQIKEVYVSKN